MSTPITEASVLILCPGEQISVRLCTLAPSGIYQIGGELVAVDSVGIRLRPAWCRQSSLPYTTPPRSTDEVAIPWVRIEQVSVPTPTGEQDEHAAGGTQ